MSRIKIVVAAATAVLALAATSTAGADVIQPLPTCVVTATSVNCTGTLIGLPAGTTHVALTVGYVCVYKFHPELVAPHSGGSVTQGADVTSPGAPHPTTYNLTVSAPTCPKGTKPVPKTVTITAAQSGVILLTVGPIPLP
jgi:hypothetical protein